MRKLKTQRTSGCIEEHFEYKGKHYVQSREDPNSNYLPKVRNDLRDIRDPHEREVVGLVAQILYRR
jgi:hypothetical protein